MSDLFLRDYAGPAFEQYGSTHLILLGMTLVLSILFLCWNPGRPGRLVFRHGVSWLLILNFFGWHGWKLAIGEWTVREMLPLHLSSLLVWLVPSMLLSRSRKLFAFCYFAGLPGTLLALMAPRLGIYGFPHFRVLSFFLAHMLIFIAPFYMIRSEGARPLWSDIPAVWSLLSAYTAAVMGINALLGSNYLFVSSRPELSEVPNILWCWPWYVLMQAVYALLLMLLLYLPFGIPIFLKRRYGGIQRLPD